eukprot:s526_g14.t2
MKIAIVGAGFGGCAAARFCREEFPDSEIHVFEKSPHVGGRARLLRHAGSPFEAGASIIHIQNRYLVKFAEEFGLGQLTPLDTRLALHDGRELLFETSDRRVVTLARMLWRYGLGPIKLDRWVGGFLKSFETIYRLQKEGKAFSTPRRLLAALDHRFSPMLDETLEDRLRRDGFNERMIQELASGMVRVNYGQGLGVGAFVGAVALCGSQGPLWAVEGGNQMLAAKMLESSRARLHRARVRQVEANDGRYQIHADIKEGEILTEDYDLVFLAAPLQNSQDLELSGISSKDLLAKVVRPYQRIYATFFESPPDAKALRCSDPVPGIILSTTGAGFNSIGLHNSSQKGDDQLIWKVFSPEPLTAEQSKKLFPNGHKCETVGWWAYPQYEATGKKLADAAFCLDGAGLYYCNAIEEAASATQWSSSCRCFDCAGGFVAAGYPECIKGEWSSLDLAKCEEAPCSDIPKVRHAKDTRACAGRKSGEICPLECLPGYQLISELRCERGAGTRAGADSMLACRNATTQPARPAYKIFLELH